MEKNFEIIMSDQGTNNIDPEQKRINKITTWGMVINILLSIIKMIVGIIIHSVSLIADGVHSLSDLITDVIVLVSSRAARRPPDINHPYGHGKFETVGSQLIGIALFLVGAGIGWEAIVALYKHEESFPGPFVVVVALMSIVSKEILFQYTRKIAGEIHSPSLYSNAWHHRSDAFSSVAVLIGGILSLVGFGYGDKVAGLVVGFMIMGVAIKIIADGYKELSEHSLDKDTLGIIENILESHSDVMQWHKLRTRKIGSECFIDVHILVAPTITVQESHELTIELEQTIEKKITCPVNTLIHVEPFLNEN